MPNWCDNYISINANEEILEKIAEFVRGEETPFDFAKIIPIPENVNDGCMGEEDKKLYDTDNWYEWRNKHWGTTRCIAEVQEARPNLFYLETAWTPCEPVIAEMARLFPEAQIEHQYEEESDGYCGKNIYHDGRLVYKMEGSFAFDWTADDPEHCTEEELIDNKIEDELYPLQENGDLCATTDDGHIHIRKYQNGRLFVKIDGTYEDSRPENERTYYW